MKQIFKILAGAAVIASSAACSQKIDFETFSYARLEAGAYTFNEDAGTVTVPVFARAKDGSPLSGGSVSFEVVDNTAKAGTDFTVEPAGGSVTLSDGKGAITIHIVNKSGEFTGDCNFYINLTGVSDGLTLGGIYNTRVTIKDLDHPLANLFGTYSSGPITDLFRRAQEVNITIEPIDGTTDGLILHDLCPYLVANGFAHGLEATYDYADNTIHVPALQDIGNVAWFLCLDEEGEDLVDEVVFSYDEAAGTIVNENVYAASPDEDGASGFYDAIPPGVTFTKQ